MIYTYRNFPLSFLVILKWWYIHTATFLYPSLLYWSDDIYIPQLFFILPCYNEVMIYTYRNFSSSFLLIMKWWYIHTATFLHPSLLYWSDDIYIPQLFFILPCYTEVMIYTYCNFSSSFLVILKWWYIHTATFRYPCLLYWSDDIYIPQLSFILPCYTEVMIYTYRNLSLSFLVILKWWYIHTATFLHPSLL